MQLFRIADQSTAWLDDVPETGMGVHVLAGHGAEERPPLLAVLSGQIAVRLDRIMEPLPDEGFLGRRWLAPGAGLEQARTAFEEWRAGLETMEVDPDRWAPVSRGALRYWVNTTGPLPKAPEPEDPVYGHLPFMGITGDDDVVYRWESSPFSQRIDQSAEKIAPGTFTAPIAEIPFMPTGLSAVGRLALPLPLPACFRWELRPPAGTVSRCGACVPLYGQSGGGVEIAFQHGFRNVGPIANPVVLPSL